jgi:hypothetical protein
MTEPDKLLQNPTSEKPGITKRATIWFGGIAAFLAATAGVIENSEKIAQTVSGVWRSLHLTTTPEDLYAGPQRFSQPVVGPDPTGSSVGLSISTHLVGRWSYDLDQELIFYRNGEIKDENMGMGRVAPSVAAGSNITVHFDKGGDCSYYGVFTNPDFNDAEFVLKQGSSLCRWRRIQRVLLNPDYYLSRPRR